MAGVVARVELQFIIGTDGRVEPASVTVLGHTSAVFDESAKHMVTGSVYRPGRRNGATIRVRVRQGVSFKDAGS
jgi:TonB family protein